MLFMWMASDPLNLLTIKDKHIPFKYRVEIKKYSQTLMLLLDK